MPPGRTSSRIFLRGSSAEDESWSLALAEGPVGIVTCVEAARQRRSARRGRARRPSRRLLERGGWRQLRRNQPSARMPLKAVQGESATMESGRSRWADRIGGPMANPPPHRVSAQGRALAGRRVDFWRAGRRGARRAGRRRPLRRGRSGAAGGDRPPRRRMRRARRRSSGWWARWRRAGRGAGARLLDLFHGGQPGREGARGSAAGGTICGPTWRSRAASRRPSGRLRRAGLSAAGMAELLGELAIEPVFTAHPTEATRRTLLEKQQAIARALVDRPRSLARRRPRRGRRWRGSAPR